MFTLFSILFVTICGTYAATCGTSKVDLSCLKKSLDYLLPIDSPCNDPVACPNKVLPWNIYFNFCGPLQTETNSHCYGSAACQQWPGDTAALGTYESVVWSDIAGGVSMQAFGGSYGTNSANKTVARTMKIDILCAQINDPSPKFVGEDATSLFYTFTWHRTEACGNGCNSNPTPGVPGQPSPPPQGPSGGGMSFPSLLLLLMFVFCVAYLILGAIYQGVVKGARGKEMIPNLTFWEEFPGLVKDGASFAKSKVARDGSYSAV